MYVADTLFINWYIIYKILPYKNATANSYHQKLENNEYWQKVNKIWLISTFLFNTALVYQLYSTSYSVNLQITSHWCMLQVQMF